MAEIYTDRAIFFPSALIAGSATGPWNLEGVSGALAQGVPLPENTRSLVIQTNVGSGIAGHFLMRFFDESASGALQPQAADFDHTTSLTVMGVVGSHYSGVTRAYVLDFGPAGTRTGKDCPWFYFSGGALPTAYFHLAVAVVLTNKVSAVSNSQQIENQ